MPFRLSRFGAGATSPVAGDRNDEVDRLIERGNGCWDPNTGGTVAPSGGTFLTVSQWKSWNGALAVAFLKGSKLRSMFLDPKGNVSFATPVLANGVRLRSAVQGPDGNLYISTDEGEGAGAIWKVTPS